MSWRALFVAARSTARRGVCRSRRPLRPGTRCLRRTGERRREAESLLLVPSSTYVEASMLPQTAVRSSPVSATKSIRTARPSASTSVGGEALRRKTGRRARREKRRASSAGRFGRIQSPRSTDSVAIARATKFLRCPTTLRRTTERRCERPAERPGARYDPPAVRAEPAAGGGWSSAGASRLLVGTARPAGGRGRLRVEQHMEEDSVFGLPSLGPPCESARPCRPFFASSPSLPSFR